MLKTKIKVLLKAWYLGMGGKSQRISGSSCKSLSSGTWKPRGGGWVTFPQLGTYRLHGILCSVRVFITWLGNQESGRGVGCEQSLES